MVLNHQFLECIISDVATPPNTSDGFHRYDTPRNFTSAMDRCFWRAISGWLKAHRTSWAAIDRI